MDNGNNDFLSQGYQVHHSLDRFGEQDRSAYLAVIYDEFKIWSRVMAEFSTVAMMMGLFLEAGFLAGGMAGVITGLIGGGTMKKHLVKRFNYIHAGAMVFLATIFGAGVGVIPYAGLIHPLALILLIGGGFPLGGMMGWLISENRNLLSKYENLKPSLARP